MRTASPKGAVGVGASILLVPRTRRSSSSHGTMPRPQRPGSRTAAHPFSLGNALTARLMKLAAHERVTLATTLVASVAALLHRYTGEDQVYLGLSGVADQRSGAGATLQPLRRDLVLCADVAGQPSVGELLQRTRKGMEDGLDGAPVGVDASADGHDAETERDRHNHFQAMNFQAMNFQAMIRLGPRAPAPPSQPARGAADLTGRPAGVDLCLEVEESATPSGVGGIAGRVLYDMELFETRTIERLTEHWHVLLESMVTEPRHPVGDLRLCTTGQRQQLLAGWGVGPEPPPVPTSSTWSPSGRKACPTPSPCSARASTTPTGNSRLGPTGWRASSVTGGWGPT